MASQSRSNTIPSIEKRPKSLVVQHRLGQIIHFVGGSYTFNVPANPSARERTDTASENNDPKHVRRAQTLNYKQQVSLLHCDKATSHVPRRTQSLGREQMFKTASLLPTDSSRPFKGKKDSDGKKAKSDNGESSDQANGKLVSCD
jgi:hypothetical protein